MVPPISEMPDVRWLGPRRFVVASEFVYATITVPAGFVCDGASIPRFLWRLLSPLDLSECAWLLHDYLYRHGTEEGWTRLEVDQLFDRINREHGVVRWKAWAAYKGVRAFGARAFRR